MIGRLKFFVCLLILLSVVGSTPASFGGGEQEKVAQPLRWRGGPVQIAVSTSLTGQAPNIVRGSDVEGAVRRSFQTWQRYVDFEFVTISSHKQSISPAGARGDGVSLITIAGTEENTLFFSNELQESAAATRVFYDKRGFITEADIALSPFQQFSTNGSEGSFDLESTLTHEIGHLLGLDHSDVLGATMHEKYGKNGAYGLSSYSARTLSLADISALQRLYGARGVAACCPKIAGSLISADGVEREWQVWAEDSQTGQVRAIVPADKDGNFSFAGLTGGSVSLFAQERSGEFVSKGELGTVTTSNSDPASIGKKVQTETGKFKLEYLGFNSQLSDIVVTLNPGNIYKIFLGGQNLDPKKMVVGFTSPYLSVDRSTAENVDFGPDVTVIKFDVRVDPRTPPGDYTVFVSGPDGMKRFIVGGFTVEGAPSPFPQFSLASY